MDLDQSQQEQHLDCTRCGFRIVNDQYVKCSSDLYHKSCFVCSQCNSSMFDDGFVYHSANKSLTCEACYLKGLPRCYKCNGKLDAGKCIQSANGDLFHPECFCCDICHQSIAKEHDAYYLMSASKLVCPDHYKITTMPRCTSCGQIIEADCSGEISWVSSSTGVFHRSCFICDQCQQGILETKGLSLFELHGKKLCVKCLTSKTTPLHSTEPRRCSFRFKPVDLKPTPKITANQLRWRT